MSGKTGNLNERAYAIAQTMLREADRIGVVWSVAGCGATIVDCGIDTAGSPEAGRLFSLACLGGTGQVSLDTLEIGRSWIPSVTVAVNEPTRGCMAAQYAGWTIRGDEKTDYFAMGSGPARALFGAEEIFREIGCAEESSVAVLALETRRYPPDSVLEYVAASCKVRRENLAVLLAPTASIVGSIQVAARIVETGLHKLHTLGFDIKRVLSGWGKAPIAPIASNDARAIGWTNDGILYGGRAWYTIDCDDEQIGRILPELPANSSSDYGTPFFDLLDRYSWDFYRIDPMLFSPAVVYLNNVRSGRTFVAGELNEKLLEEQWFAAHA